MAEKEKNDGQMTTAEVLVRCLENEGVKYIFGIPGEENLEIMKALQKSSIEFITVRHEQGAAFMADMQGRLTGKAGVCLATLGPGATNLMTGVADANMDGAPLIAITGQVGTERMHLTSHQYLDLVEMFEPVTKRSKQVVRPDTVNEIVRIAFKYAESEKPGACHIDLPCNIAAMEVPEGAGRVPIRPVYSHMELADDKHIEKAAKLINQAKQPILLIGHSAVRNRAEEAIRSFSQHLRLPAVNTMMSKGVIPADSPMCMGTIGIPDKDFPNYILDEADLVIAIGYDIVEFAPRKWNKDNAHPIIHIDTRQNHVNKYYQPETEVIGDISSSLQRLDKLCTSKDSPEWALGILQKMLDYRKPFETDEAFPMKPQRILADVRKALGREDILISDVGAHKMWIAREYPGYEPNTCIISNGFATMGIAVPGAVAAKLLFPEKKVLAVTGDGGFMMNCQELETAYRLGNPFVTLIFRDSAYGLIKWKEEERYGTHFNVDFSDPDFVLFAESMHLKAYRVTKADDLLPMLNDAFAQKVPSVIDCEVDYGENMKLTEYLKTL